MMSTLAINIIGCIVAIICGNSTPTYTVGSTITVDVQPALTLVSVSPTSDYTTITETFQDASDAGIIYQAEFTVTNVVAANHSIITMFDAIKQMTVSAKVISKLGNTYVLDNVNIVARPTMLQNATGALSSVVGTSTTFVTEHVTGAYSTAKTHVSNAASTAAHAVRNSLADALVTMANKVR